MSNLSHYFSENPGIESERRIIGYKINGKSFELVTDNGVFSKSRVDFGTDLMLNVFLKENREPVMKGGAEGKRNDSRKSNQGITGNSKSGFQIRENIMTERGISENSESRILEQGVEVNVPGKIEILDIGCGYGVVSVVIKSFLPHVSVTLSDVNERALELSRENLIKYGVEDFTIIKSDAFSEIDGSFDFILSNPPIRAGKETVFKIYGQAYDHLKEGGKFYCVIQTKHGAKSTQKKLEEIFGNCGTRMIEGGYRIYMAEKGLLQNK